MNKINIEKELKGYRPMPNSNWQENTLTHLNNLPEAVTSEQDHRNRSSLFNFLEILQMQIKYKTGLILTTLALVMMGSIVTVYAANETNPGDLLYPVDLAGEQVQRAFTFGPLAQAELEMRIMDERVLELRTLSLRSDSAHITEALNQVEAQRLKLQARIEELNRIRNQGDVEEGQQQKLMQQLANQTRSNNDNLDELGQELTDTNLSELEQIKQQYTTSVTEQIRNFENETGLKLQESEQNGGEEIQNQNQQQTQNQGESSGAPETAPKQNGKN